MSTQTEAVWQNHKQLKTTF